MTIHRHRQRTASRLPGHGQIRKWMHYSTQNRGNGEYTAGATGTTHTNYTWGMFCIHLQPIGRDLLDIQRMNQSEQSLEKDKGSSHEMLLEDINRSSQ